MHPSTTDGVHRSILDNGLTVLVKENHASPVAAVLAHVGVGYFNEPDEWNGIAHVVEHMFFKGTERRPGKEQIAEEVRALGGSINAGTYYDETSYYIVLPSENAAKAIELQADTFLGSRFDSAELAKEIEVIIQESKQKRDNPGAMAVETMYARAFDRHRIRRWRIGPDEVLRALRSEDLAEFVRRTYRPENIVLAIVGDFEIGTVLDAVARWWGPMDRGTVRKEESESEPPRSEFRFARLEADIQQRLVEVGFHVPCVLDPDSAPLMALGSLLSDGRSARSYRILKEERRLANSVWAGYEGFADLGLFTMGLDAAADDPLEAERALFEVACGVVASPPTVDELDRVKTRIESRRLYGQEEVLGVARTLASYQSLGDYRLSDEMLYRLRAVSAEDMARVAQTYVAPARATLLEYLPVSAVVPERTREEMQAALCGGNAPLAPIRMTGETGDISQVLELVDGASCVYRHRGDLPLVAMHILFPGGRTAERAANAGITNLMLKASLKGAASLSATEIAQRIERLGSSIGLSLTADYFGYSLKLLADRFEEGLDVLRQVLQSPVFAEDEVEKERQAVYGEIRRHRDSMSARSMDLFNSCYYGETGYGLPASGDEESVARFMPTDLREWHARWVRADRAILGVVGAIGEDELRHLLDGFVPMGAQALVTNVTVGVNPPGERSVSMERHQSASVMGFEGVDLEHEDRHALDLIAEITSGLAGRFFRSVRGDNALAYAVSSFNRSRRVSGAFITYTATSPDRELAAREIILEECRRLQRENVPEEELAAAKTAIRGEHVIGLQSFGAQAGELAVNRLHGRPLDATERYLEQIDAVSPREIQAAASRYLTPDRYWLGVVRGTA